MSDFFERRPILAGAGIIAALLVVIGLLTVAGGGQVDRILSTVGSSVGGAPMEPAPEEPQTADDGAGAQPTATFAPAGQDALAPAPGLLIVRTGTIRIEVDEVDQAVDRVSTIVTAAGGYVAGSKTSASGSGDGASIDLRIPSERWDPTLTSLRALGTVRDQQIGTEEVTGQVVDLDARVRNLRATEAALQAIMAKATKIDDILDVQKQLTDTRGEIEQLAAKAASLRDRAAFGSLTVALSMPPAPRPSVTPAPKPGWDPGRDAAAATAKLVRIGQTATTAGIWFAIVGIPLLVSLAVGLALLRLGWLVLRWAGLFGGREPI